MPPPQPEPLQPVSMLDFSREYAPIRTEVLAAIESVCDTQRFILGPEVAQFEQSAATFLQVPHAAGCGSGTDALWLALAALNIGPGDTVITTPFSFFASVSSILRAGATPLLADIDPQTFNLSPTSVAELANTHGDIAAVMPVHLYGQCADMDAFSTLAHQHNFKLIEDAAQAFGAKWRSKKSLDNLANIPAGALGDAAAFSFYPTKNLAAFGEAGLVTTNSAATDERVRMLRAHGMRRRYFHDEPGWNSRLDTLQAAVLQVKLRRVAAGNQRRRDLAALYDTAFTAANLTGPTTAEGIVLPHRDPRAEHIFHQYVIRAPHRDALRAHLTAHKIGSEIYYPLPLHRQKALTHLGYKPGDFPQAEHAAAEVLALPIYPELREDEITTVVEAIRRFYA